MKKHILDLAPGAGNPRNSEGAFITLNNGDILFAWSRYCSTSYGDGAPADIYGILSKDGGDSFGEPFPIISHGEAGGTNVMSVSFLRMQNGDIGLFYLRKNDPWQCHTYLIRSSDEGKTWSAPRLCVLHEGYHIVNNDRIIRLASGRILIPVALLPMLRPFDGAPEGTPAYRLPCSVLFYASDDDGETWFPLGHGASIGEHWDGEHGLEEPGVFELPNGSVRAFCRTQRGCQYDFYSVDGGKIWTPPAPSRFTGPDSPLSMKKLSDGRVIAVWNPIPWYNGRTEPTPATWGRTPLVAAISYDGGMTFTAPKTVEDDPLRGYAYIAIHGAEDGSVLLAYCAGDEADGCMLNRLRITKLLPDFFN